MSFNSILSSVSYTLGNSRANWEEQKDAIRKLRGLCSQYSNMFKANYIDINIKLGLIRCVGDNRSGLVTETCGAIVDLCTCVGQSMEPIASDIFLNIIEKAASGVSTISMAVTDCCLNMVKCLYMEKVILNLERYLNHRSDKVQITAASCVKLIVTYWPETIIRKHYQQLMNLMESGIKAPRSEVRMLMRDSQDIMNQKYSDIRNEKNAGKSLYTPSPRRTMTPSTSTAIKSIQAISRNSATPRGVEQATRKTGIVPRTVETPKYKSVRTTQAYVSAVRSPSTPTPKTVTSRITGNTPSSAYTVNRVHSSPRQTPVPRKASNLSATPLRSLQSTDSPEYIARMDRELEKVPLEQKTAFSLFQRVRVRGNDGKPHPALVQYVGRTKGSKRVVYGVFYQDSYSPEGNGTYFNRHYVPKDTLISEYVPETDVIPYLPSTPNRSLTSSRVYQEQPSVRVSKEEVEQTSIEMMRDTSETMKQLVTLMKDFHVMEDNEELRKISGFMIQKLKRNIDNAQSMIDKLQFRMYIVCYNH